MPFSLSDFPFGPGAFLGAGLYAAVSVFGTGPMVGTRTIERSGWSATCEAGLRADLSASVSPPPVSTVPTLDCNSTFGALFGRDGQALCREYGNFGIPIPGADALRQQERNLRAAEEQRIARAASQTGSRCSCASAVYQAEHRVPLAVYAGTARAITPPQVRNLTSVLTRALRSPQCTGAWGA